MLELEVEGRKIVQRGEVAWSIGAPERERAQMMCGMGISFPYPEPAWVEFVEEWMASHVVAG